MRTSFSAKTRRAYLKVCHSLAAVLRLQLTGTGDEPGKIALPPTPLQREESLFVDEENAPLTLEKSNGSSESLVGCVGLF